MMAQRIWALGGIENDELVETLAECQILNQEI